MACGHAGNQGCVDQLADALARQRRVVADEREIGFPLPHQLIEQSFRRSDPHESTYHDRRPVRDHRDGFFGGNGLHDGPPSAVENWTAKVAAGHTRHLDLHQGYGDGDRDI